MIEMKIIQPFGTVLIALFILFGLMMLGLKFAKYKERSAGCGEGHCVPFRKGGKCCGHHEG